MAAKRVRFRVTINFCSRSLKHKTHIQSPPSREARVPPPSALLSPGPFSVDWRRFEQVHHPPDRRPHPWCFLSCPALETIFCCCPTIVRMTIATMRPFGRCTVVSPLPCWAIPTPWSRMHWGRARIDSATPRRIRRVCIISNFPKVAPRSIKLMINRRTHQNQIGVGDPIYSDMINFFHVRDEDNQE